MRGDVVVMESVGILIVSENSLDAVWGGVAVSATCSVKVKVPGVVGGPLITPADKFNPAGSVLPVWTDHV